MTEQSPILTVDLPQGRRLTFATFDEIANWIGAEQQRLNWLVSASDLGPGNRLRDHYQNGFQFLRTRLQEWRTQPSNPTGAQALANTFSSFYSNHMTCLSDAPPVQCAIEIEKEIGPRAAAGAFALLMGVPCAIDFDTVRGIMRATLLRDGIEPTSPALVTSTIARLTSDADAVAQNRSQSWRAIEEKADAFVSDKTQLLDKQAADTNERVQGFVERLNAGGNEAIASIHATEIAYKEQMRLQAPVDYWQTKADVHRNSLDSSRRNLIIYAIAGTVVLSIALVWLALKSAEVAAAGNATTDAVAIYLKFVAVGAIITTIAFWAGRVLLRIYLSDRHLLSDAEERVAMIKTYLALTHEGKVEASDRALVLAPIFRSAADGIVKEEGPDPSIAGIIAKAIDLKGR